MAKLKVFQTDKAWANLPELKEGQLIFVQSEEEKMEMYYDFSGSERRKIGLMDAIGDINSILDEINGQVI